MDLICLHSFERRRFDSTSVLSAGKARAIAHLSSENVNSKFSLSRRINVDRTDEL